MKLNKEIANERGMSEVHEFQALALAMQFFSESTKDVYELYDDGSEGWIEDEEDMLERFQPGIWLGVE